MLKDIFPQFHFWPPAPEARIAEAEALFGIRIPTQLREFYLECDGFREDRGNSKYLLSLLEDDFAGSLVSATRFMWTEVTVLDFRPFIFFGFSNSGEYWGIHAHSPHELIAYHHLMENEYETVGWDLVALWKAEYARYGP
jgi:hypothetical protein